jgi:hypothetical protein
MSKTLTICYFLKLLHILLELKMQTSTTYFTEIYNIMLSMFQFKKKHVSSN